MSFDYKMIFLQTSSFGIPSMPKSIITENLVATMNGLLAWRFLTPEARAAWDVGCSYNAFSAKPAGHLFLSTGYYALWQLRRRAFPDPSFKTVSPAIIVSYPWCLTPVEFQACYNTIKSGQLPTLDGSVPTDWAAEYGKWTAVPIALGSLLVRGATSFAGRLVFGMSMVGNVVTVASALSYGYGKLELSDFRMLYATDQKRRDYASFLKTFV